MAKSNKRFFKKDIEEIDAILPFMSLLIIIIPLLLSNLAFYHFRVIETSFPGASDPDQTSEATPQKKKEKNVMAQLFIEPEKTILKVLDETDGSTVKKVVTKSDKSGARKIFDTLKGFKAEFKKLDTVIVTTHEEVTYNGLIQVLDPIKQPIALDEKKRETASKKDDEEGFKFKIVILPATAEKSLGDA